MRKKRVSQKTLSSGQARRAQKLTRQLTVFDSFASLLANYRGMPGGYRLGHCRLASAALMAKWSPDDREHEQREHSLQLELAHLAEVAEGVAGPNRITVYSPKLVARRAA